MERFSGPHGGRCRLDMPWQSVPLSDGAAGNAAAPVKFHESPPAGSNRRNWHRVSPVGFQRRRARVLGSTGRTKEYRLMRSKLLITTAAAALVAGTVFAGAQEHKQGGGGAAQSGGVAQIQHQQGKGGALGQRGEQRTSGQGQREG